ncbi:hypothetical protein ACGFI3_20670 [Nonomuraea wenchangensis]|uniref:hypothetical protein n=1 Tax=Nonomuraea wenchangensis TaxID=568860 RepID=UPI0037208536
MLVRKQQRVDPAAEEARGDADHDREHDADDAGQRADHHRVARPGDHLGEHVGALAGGAEQMAAARRPADRVVVDLPGSDAHQVVEPRTDDRDHREEGDDADADADLHRPASLVRGSIIT